MVNPLVCETSEERKIYQAGEVNKLHRKLLQEESLFRVPPNESGAWRVTKLGSKDESSKPVCVSKIKEVDVRRKVIVKFEDKRE